MGRKPSETTEEGRASRVSCGEVQLNYCVYVLELYTLNRVSSFVYYSIKFPFILNINKN